MNKTNDISIYLQHAKNFIRNPEQQNSGTHLVLGNEAADLDSIVSAIVYAFYLTLQNEKDHIEYIPVVCIKQDELELRTETIALFKHLCLSTDDLVFLSDIDIQDYISKYEDVNVTLVDHNNRSHESKIKDLICNIIDHHKDSHEHLNAQKNIKMVGSCCTLVAEQIYYSRNQMLSVYPVANLLLAGILLDTLNLDLHNGRTTELDVFFGEVLSQYTEMDSGKYFALLQEAKFNISTMSTMNILRKDYKRVPLQNIGISLITLETKVFLLREDTLSSMFDYMKRVNINVLVLMFLFYDQHSHPHRQLAIVTESEKLMEDVSSYLLSHSELEVKSKNEFLQDALKTCIRLFEHQVKSSRKVILPLLQMFE